MLNPEQIKTDNIKLLNSLGIHTIEHLPTLETLSELSPVSSIDVARRAIVLTYVIGIGYGVKAGKLNAAVNKFGLAPYLSNRERDLLSRNKHSNQEKIDATWVDECIQAFAWCLGLADLDHSRHCDDDLAERFPEPYTDPSVFIEAAKLRPFEEIYRRADFRYRLHWASRHPKADGADLPITQSIIRERRRALDWVIGVEPDWDEVPSDT